MLAKVSRRARLHAVATAVALFPLVPCAAAAQHSPPAADIQLPYLLTLPDESAPVLYTPGSLDRAAHTQAWLRVVTETSWLRLKYAEPLRIVVLPRDEWERMGTGVPYGLPLVSERGVLALPAQGDDGTVALWRTAVDELPPIPGNPLMGTIDEAASLVAADFVAAPAAGSLLALGSGFSPAEDWVGELLGHLLALDAAREEGMGRAEAMSAFWREIRRSADAAAEVGEAPAGPLAAELVRHSYLAGAAESILATEKRLPGRALRKMQERAGGTLRSQDLAAEWPSPFARLVEAQIVTLPQH
jgi:hypothetical protein